MQRYLVPMSLLGVAAKVQWSCAAPAAAACNTVAAANTLRCTSRCLVAAAANALHCTCLSLAVAATAAAVGTCAPGHCGGGGGAVAAPLVLWVLPAKGKALSGGWKSHQRGWPI